MKEHIYQFMTIDVCANFFVNYIIIESSRDLENEIQIRREHTITRQTVYVTSNAVGFKTKNLMTTRQISHTLQSVLNQV